MRVSYVTATTVKTTTAIRKARMASFESFYKSEYKPLLGMAIALTSDPTAAEDLVQEVFISAHGRWDRVSQYENPRGWLRRVLINRATSRRRRLGSELKALTRLGAPDPAPPDLSAETSQVWDEVRLLPRRQQQAVVLHYVGELTVREAADVMGCSTGAVKSHLHRARVALEAPLAAYDEERS